MYRMTDEQVTNEVWAKFVLLVIAIFTIILLYGAFTGFTINGKVYTAEVCISGLCGVGSDHDKHAAVIYGANIACKKVLGHISDVDLMACITNEQQQTVTFK
jgi:hypothetical protein